MQTQMLRTNIDVDLDKSVFQSDFVLGACLASKWIDTVDVYMRTGGRYLKWIVKQSIFVIESQRCTRKSVLILLMI